MADVLTLTAPIYLLIGAGWAAARWRLVGAADLAAVGRLVLALCLPPLIFRAVLGAGDGAGAALDWRLVGAVAVAALLVLAAGAAWMRVGFGRAAPAAWLLALGMAAPNSIFVGYPVAAQAFGAGPAGAVLAQLLLVENLVLIPAALVLTDLAAGGGGAARAALARALGGLVRNPLIWAIAAALAALVLGLRPPEPVDRALAMLAAVAPGAALLVVGGAMASHPPRGEIGPALAIAAGKLVAHPLAVLAATVAAGVPPQAATVAVVFSAAPMLTIYPILAGRHAEGALPATALVAATVLSFGSVSLALAWAS